MNWYAASLVPAANASMFSLFSNHPAVSVVKPKKVGAKKQIPKKKSMFWFPMAKLLSNGKKPAVSALVAESKPNSLDLTQRETAEEMSKQLHVNFFEPIGSGVNAKVFRLNKRKMKDESKKTVLRRVTALSNPISNEMGLRDPLFLNEFKKSQFVPRLVASYEYDMNEDEVKQYQIELKEKHEDRIRRKLDPNQLLLVTEQKNENSIPVRHKRPNLDRVYIRQDIFMERLKPLRLKEKNYNLQDEKEQVVKYFTMEKSIMDEIVRCIYWLSDKGIIHGDLKFDQFLLKLRQEEIQQRESENYDSESLNRNDDDDEKEVEEEEKEEEENARLENVKISDFGFSGGLLPKSKQIVYPIEGWTVVHKYTRPVSKNPICNHTKDRIFMPLEQATRADALYYNLWQLTWSWLVLPYPLLITVDGQEEFLFAGFTDNIEDFARAPTAFCRDLKQDYRTNEDRMRIQKYMNTQYKNMTTIRSWMKEMGVDLEFKYDYEMVNQLISTK